MKIIKSTLACLLLFGSMAQAAQLQNETKEILIINNTKKVKPGKRVSFTIKPGSWKKSPYFTVRKEGWLENNCTYITPYSYEKSFNVYPVGKYRLKVVTWGSEKPFAKYKAQRYLVDPEYIGFLRWVDAWPTKAYEICKDAVNKAGIEF